MLFLWKEGGLLYPVSEAFLQAVQENTRRYYWTGTITTTKGVVYEFGPGDIVKGSGYISSQCCNSTEIELGTVYSAEMGITLLTDIDRYTLEDALVELFYHLRLPDGSYEEVPMGIFEVSEANRKIRCLELKAYAEVIIASNVYSCPECKEEIVLYKNETGKRSEYRCAACGRIISLANKDDKSHQIDKRRPVEVTIKAANPGASIKKEVRSITESDKLYWNNILNEYETEYGDLWAPDERIVYNRAYPRIGGWPGFPIDSTVSDLFPKNNLLALKILNHYIETEIRDENVCSFMKFIFLETLFRTSSRLFTGSGIKNVYHIPPVGKEQNVLTVFKRKYKSISEAKAFLQNKLAQEQTKNDVRIIKCDAKNIPVPNCSVDYAFIDPPYGGMVPYAELNLFYSAWLHEKEDLEEEIMIPMDYEKKEGFVELWGSYIERAFGEVFRVLKPGAYFTVVFHSTFSNIWNELKDIMQVRLGFEFVNIVENERGTTFHTNHINDTNPVSAFITYRKAEDGLPHPSKVHTAQNAFEIFDTAFLEKGKTFRAIQSQIIKLVNEYNLAEVPDDKAIEKWLGDICNKTGTKYFLK